MKIGQFIIQYFVNDAFMDEDEQHPIVNDIGRWSKTGLDTTQIKGSAATNEPYFFFLVAYLFLVACFFLAFFFLFF